MQKTAKILILINALAIVLSLAYFAFSFWPGQALPELPARPTLTKVEESKTLEGKPFVIAAILPLSGEHALLGSALENALLLAAEEINAKDGIGGGPVSLIVADGGCERVQTKNELGEILNNQNIQGIIAGCSSEVAAASSLTQKAGVLLIAPAASKTESASHKNVFWLVPDQKTTAQQEQKYQKEHGQNFTLRPFWNEREKRASDFFKKYQSRYGRNPDSSWYLANAYSAVFLLKDLAAGETNKNLWPKILMSREWNSGLLQNLKFDPNGRPIWKEFVVSRTSESVNRDIEVVKL